VRRTRPALARSSASLLVPGALGSTARATAAVCAGAVSRERTTGSTPSPVDLTIPTTLQRWRTYWNRCAAECYVLFRGRPRAFLCFHSEQGRLGSLTGSEASDPEAPRVPRRLGARSQGLGFTRAPMRRPGGGGVGPAGGLGPAGMGYFEDSFCARW
jgi:hypothetical protein